MTKILVVDDESALMRLVQLTLRQYNLIQATTGEEALLCFIDHDHKIDLLIADLSLPELSGINLALLLRSTLPDLPVILTSGYPVSAWSERDSGDLERLGSHLVTILQKPFEVQALKDTVGELLEAAVPQKTATASHFG